tara:strand:- start:165 stop:437 length:273 start_codon:yes stop_codon:yes gene_type:complete
MHGISMSAKHYKNQTEPEWADEKYITHNFGLTHTPLFNLRKAGKIRSLSTRGEGAKYGKRLFNVASVRAFLAAQEARELVGASTDGEGAR